ncbi:MAG: hypothetical protein ACRCYQ_04185 [Nocardioides sp.]
MSFDQKLNASAALLLLLAAGYHFSWSPSRQRAHGQPWAKKNLAYVESDLVGHIDARWRWESRLRGATILAMAAQCAWLVYTDTLQEYFLRFWVVMIAVGATGLVARAILMTRPVGDARTRALARVRQVRTTDYAHPLSHACVTASGVIGLSLILTLLVFPDLVVASARVPGIIAGVAVFTSAGCAAWAARRICRQPIPARDAAHLYWQDALRADQIRRCYYEADLWGLQAALWFIADRERYLTQNASGLLAVVPLGLMVMTLIADHLGDMRFRKRLWPALAPGQVLMPGETPARLPSTASTRHDGVDGGP